MIDLQQVSIEIESTVDAWRAKLLQLEASLAHEKPAPDRWSISEVIGHLVDSACNNHQRFVRAQFCDELTFPKYEQNDWVTAASYGDFDWESLVQLWFHYNRMLAHLIRQIDKPNLATSCTITPYDACTLEFLIRDYVDHLHHHLDILDQRIETA